MDPIHGYHQTWLGNSRSWRTMEVYFAKSFNDMGIFCPASHGNHIGWVYSWGYPLVNIHIAIFHISIASWFTQLFSLWWIFPVRKLSTLRVFHVPQLLDVDVTGTQLWLGARFCTEWKQCTALLWVIFFHMDMPYLKYHKCDPPKR